MKAFCQQLEWGIYGQLVTAFVISSIALMFVDPWIIAKVQSYHHPILRTLEKTGAWLGKQINPWMIVLSLYLFFKTVLRNDSLSLKMFGALLSGVAASLATAFLKYTTLRARPYGERGPFSFLNIEGITQDARLHHSFPSGDVVVVAGACYFLWNQFKNYKVSFLLLILPLMTAYSRIYLNKHWPSDTFMALGLGWIAALFFTEYHRYSIREANER